MDKMIYFVPVFIILGLLVVTTKNRPKQRDVSELPKPSDAVLAEVGRGEKIAAIRAYRKQTGASLPEAVRVVERHMAAS